jgi:hypothetical protein
VDIALVPVAVSPPAAADDDAADALPILTVLHANPDSSSCPQPAPSLPVPSNASAARLSGAAVAGRTGALWTT